MLLDSGIATIWRAVNTAKAGEMPVDKVFFSQLLRRQNRRNSKVLDGAFPQ